MLIIFMLTLPGKSGIALQCPNPMFAWADTYPEGHHYIIPVNHAVAVTGIVTDAVIYLLSLRLLLSLPLKRKIRGMFCRIDFF